MPPEDMKDEKVYKSPAAAAAHLLKLNRLKKLSLQVQLTPQKVAKLLLLHLVV